MISKINEIQEPCKIIYLSACHNPEQVENDPWASWTVNVLALNYLLKELRQVKILIYASSDAVYGESRERHRFKEDDRTDPANMYGIQKLSGEGIVRRYGQHAFRYSLLTGPSLNTGRKHFFDVIRESLSGGESVDLFSDAFRCMLDFGTAAVLTVDLIEHCEGKLPDVLNISGDDALSKYDIGMMIARKYKKEERLIIPVSFAEDNKIFKTKRAASILTDNSRLKELLRIDKVTIDL